MAEYRDYKSLESVVELKHGDIIYFGTMEYKVYTSCLYACFENSDIIFSKLDITDKYTFCNNVYRYKSNPGVFPNCYEEDYKALARIARALMVLYEEKFGKQTDIPNTSESLFKVGDRVTILSKYLPGTVSNSYAFGFIADIPKCYAGKVCTITTVTKSERNLQHSLSNDPYKYNLKAMGWDCGDYEWSAEMFEETYQKSPYSAAKKQDLLRTEAEKYIEGISLHIFDSKYTINSEPEIRIKINKKHYTI